MTSASPREWGDSTVPASGASVGDDRVVNIEQDMASGHRRSPSAGIQAELAPTTPGQVERSVDPVRVRDIDQCGCAVRDVGVNGMGAVGLPYRWRARGDRGFRRRRPLPSGWGECHLRDARRCGIIRNGGNPNQSAVPNISCRGPRSPRTEGGPGVRADLLLPSVTPTICSARSAGWSPRPHRQSRPSFL
jgi:hypothetical protein